MRRIKTLLLVTTLLAGSPLAALADMKVVASIKPVHSLVAGVMEGVGTPELVVDGAGSPHNYALKPSQARMLEEADVVFWVGESLEAFLEKPVQTLAAKAKTIELIDAHDLVKKGFREGGAFDDHDDEAEAKSEEHHDHDGHDHGKKKASGHDHDHDKKEADAHGHEGHNHGSFDPHIWLDPVNAKALVHEIEEALIKADPNNAEKYRTNARSLNGRLDQLVTEITTELEPIRGKGFVVFHDAYQYFENRFGLEAAGSITISPEVMPGAERISEIRAKVQQLGAACVFAEPQFEPRLVATVTEGTKAKSGVIDPLGASLEDGPDLYFNLIRGMATSFRTCLSEAS